MNAQSEANTNWRGRREGGKETPVATKIYPESIGHIPMCNKK